MLLKGLLCIFATSGVIFAVALSMNYLRPKAMIRRKEFLVKPKKYHKKIPWNVPDKN